jgi:hypothetical protein
MVGRTKNDILRVIVSSKNPIVFVFVMLMDVFEGSDRFCPQPCTALLHVVDFYCWNVGV